VPRLVTMIPAWIGAVERGELSFAPGVVRRVGEGGLAVQHVGSGGQVPRTGQTVTVVPRALGGAGSVLGRVIDSTVDGDVTTLHVALVPPDQASARRLLGLG
jgi:hypothetical protein